MTTLSKAIEWARDAEDGDILVTYADSGVSDEKDSGSRCGFGDDEIDAIDRELRKRDLRLEADDVGLVATAVQS